MYSTYFDLQSHPFRITSDPSMFCPVGGRGEILEALIYAITSGEGIIKVVGEVGSGKTMLCRILAERLPTSVEIVYLANPNLSPAEILYAIAFDLKLPVTAATERLQLMQQLQNYLLKQHSAARNVVVLIEEAQGMPIATLEEIRLLSNLETHHHKLLQIVVFGQPELDSNLRKRQIRQLKERITHSFYLEPLRVSEVDEYIRFRLQAAGCARSGLFDRRAVRMIAKASRGLIRRITILADKAMLAAYSASIAGTLSGDLRAGVNARHVRAAIGDSEFCQSRIRPSPMLTSGMLVVILTIALAVVFTRSHFPGAISLPSLLSAKAMFVGRIPPAGSGGTVDQVREESGFRDESAEQHVQANPDLTGEKQQKSEAEIGSASYPTNAGQVFSKTTEMLAEGYTQEVGKNDKVVTAVPRKLAGTSGTTLLNLRREATAQWLQSVHPDNFTIQLLTASIGDEMDLENLLRRISSESVLDKSYICRVRLEETDRWVVLYNEYQGVQSARRALDDLPPELRRAQPYVRSLKKVLLSLHTDSKQNL